MDQAYLSQGITFDHGGREQPFPFDLLPRLIPAGEWERLEAGLAQRVRALDLFVGDLYGPRRSIADGVVPNALVSTCEGYVRAMAGVEPPLGRYVHVSGHRPGARRRRRPGGCWRTTCAAPPGCRTSSRTGRSCAARSRRPSATTTSSRSGHAPFLLLSALMAAAPEGRESPRVVVLTPGPVNAAYYEHAFLAQQMGVPWWRGAT